MSVANCFILINVPLRLHLEAPLLFLFIAYIGTRFKSHIEAAIAERLLSLLPWNNILFSTASICTFQTLHIYLGASASHQNIEYYRIMHVFAYRSLVLHLVLVANSYSSFSDPKLETVCVSYLHYTPLRTSD